MIYNICNIVCWLLGAEVPPQVLVFAHQAFCPLSVSSAPGFFFLNCNFTDKPELGKVSTLGPVVGSTPWQGCTLEQSHFLMAGGGENILQSL